MSDARYYSLRWPKSQVASNPAHSVAGIQTVARATDRRAYRWFDVRMVAVVWLIAAIAAL